MEERTRRIVKTAIQLAEEGGFAAVRLRDVAAKAGVALGTVYKRFESKEDILVAALEMEVAGVRVFLSEHFVQKADAADRVEGLFMLLTDYLCSRPNFARAVIRSMASLDASLTGRVAVFYGTITEMIVCALRGLPFVREEDEEPLFPELEEAQLIDILQHVWFAALVGWAGGLHLQEETVAKVGRAARLSLLGLAVEKE